MRQNENRIIPWVVELEVLIKNVDYKSKIGQKVLLIKCEIFFSFSKCKNINKHNDCATPGTANPREGEHLICDLCNMHNFRSYYGIFD